MLSWALTFFIVALVAALFGFTGIAAGAAAVAKFLFFLFVGLLNFRPGNADPQLFANDYCGIVVNIVRNGRHNAELHQHLNQVDGTAIH